VFNKLQLFVSQRFIFFHLQNEYVKYTILCIILYKLSLLLFGIFCIRSSPLIATLFLLSFLFCSSAVHFISLISWTSYYIILIYGRGIFILFLAMLSYLLNTSIFNNSINQSYTLYSIYNRLFITNTIDRFFYKYSNRRSNIISYKQLRSRELTNLHIHTGVNKPVICGNHWSHSLYVIVVNPTLSFAETSISLLTSLQQQIESNFITVNMPNHRLACLEAHSFHYLKFKSEYWFRDKHTHLLIPVLQPTLGKNGLIVDIYPWKHLYETNTYIIV